MTRLSLELKYITMEPSIAPVALDVPGLYVYPEFISPQQEVELLAEVDAQPWNSSLKRLTQHYGRQYDYTARSADTTAPPMPPGLAAVADALIPVMQTRPQQCIINQYTRTQGINAHIDSFQFGPVVSTISLGDGSVMIFSRDGRTVAVALEPCSLVVMTGDSRNLWKHEIPSRVTITMPDGSAYTKPTDYRRVSLTYRTMA